MEKNYLDVRHPKYIENIKCTKQGSLIQTDSVNSGIESRLEHGF